MSSVLKKAPCSSMADRSDLSYRLPLLPSAWEAGEGPRSGSIATSSLPACEGLA